MNFERHETQLYIEDRLGCNDISRWKGYKKQLEEYVISQNDEIILQYTRIDDAASYYLKALLSFCQAIDGLQKHESTWSIVRLYYSIFYLLRCNILVNGFIIARCSSLYAAKAKAGEMFKSCKYKDAPGDHQLTIRYAEDLHKNGLLPDPLFTNLIENDNVFIWAMKQRERVNYQQKNFTDPQIDHCLTNVKGYIDSGLLKDLFVLYDNDTTLQYCFDIDHLMVSVPYMLLRRLYPNVKPNLQSNIRIYSSKLIECRNLLKEYEVQSYIKSKY